MKTLLLSLTIFCLSSFTFGKSLPDNALPQLNLELDDTTACYTSNYRVYPQGVAFWRLAWFSFFNLDSSLTSLALNQREFSNENLQYVINTDGYSGIRVYYGLSSPTDPFPSLIIVPVDSSCKDIEGAIADSSVLVSTGTSQYFCSMRNASELTENWRNYSNTHQDSIKSLVYAYNYDADIINDLLTNGIAQGNLMFELGLRTLAPQEVDFHVYDQGYYGSIIYCNLLYGTAYSSSDGRGRYDFAKPCPHICDYTSPLATDK